MKSVFLIVALAVIAVAVTVECQKPLVIKSTGSPTWNWAQPRKFKSVSESFVDDFLQPDEVPVQPTPAQPKQDNNALIMKALQLRAKALAEEQARLKASAASNSNLKASPAARAVVSVAAIIVVAVSVLLF
eukprot:TRINITY_DN22791_c0_g1_i1.p1 TRINITY_DN22791_c0_g1~~TRINITY_DN22791_c0_g1_i1.p1  ORF type:complete len:131 (-),score=37.88 TRINITY_DN22791_c0_g1_i1:202-594(-)